ncbi:hypothetical protein PR202_ga13707 [Eleusine coracana subsp. coracana]|uniref:Glutathione S-transferase n=1 Tax=Eleusine coracana subsp. coracana TaxID=191504 RepID=A0AAV5CFG4_ELECO|nr:hypothetical protein QOZ80_3AG0213460 [Eleusine coracana subsp. coracana]GJM96838.1 hypothetical protein PR202_ga13707 [Eleusine coracana subsp. coracana]
MAAQQPKSDLVLLDVFGSPFAQRVRIALAEKGLAYERAEEDLFAKSDLLLRSNPIQQKIPVLLHAGRGPVCESLAILQYLDDAFPATRRLLPAAADPYERARARFWAEYSDRAHSCGKRLWMTTRDGDGHEEARAELLRVLRAMDAELGDREFFGGEEAGFGYVDAAAAPFAAWFRVYERYGGFSVAEECPRLAAWAARCARQGSVADNVYAPDKVCELVELYKQRVLGQQAR